MVVVNGQGVGISNEEELATAVLAVVTGGESSQEVQQGQERH